MAAHLRCSHMKGPSLPVTQILPLLMLDSSTTGQEGVFGLVTTLTRFPDTDIINETFKKLQLKCPPWLLTEAGRRSTYAYSVDSFLQHIY